MENNQTPQQGEPKDIKPGFETLLHQNEIAEAQEKAQKKIETLEEKIRKDAPEKPQSIVRNIRTYKSDIEEGISSGNTTLVGMATAQSSVKGVSKQIILSIQTIDSQKIKKILIALLSLLLLIGGAGGIYYAYTLKAKSEVIVANEPEPLIFVENIKNIDGTGKTTSDARKAFIDIRHSVSGQLGSIVQTLLVKKSVDDKGVSKTLELTTEEMFQIFGFGAPARLVRSLNPAYLVGVHIFDGNQPIVILKTDSYETTFAGMLEWEEDMERNLKGLLRDEADFAQIGTSTPFVTRAFDDIIYKNTDMRALKNEKGKVLLAYAFPTRDVLILGTNTDSIIEAMNRFNTRKVVR